MRPRACLLVSFLLLAACAHAGFERARVFESPGLFRLGDPGAGWHLHRNVRWGSRYLVDYQRDDADVDLRVSVEPLDPETRSLPLPALVEGLVEGYGRSRGLETRVDAIERVDFGAHEGLVVQARRYWAEGPRTPADSTPSRLMDPEEEEPLVIPSPSATPAASGRVPIHAGGFTLEGIPLVKVAAPRAGSPLPRGYAVSRRLLQAFVRTRERLVMLSYVAPPDLYEKYAPEVAVALSRFTVLDEARPPEIGLTLPGDLPGGEERTGGEAGTLPVSTPPPAPSP